MISTFERLNTASIKDLRDWFTSADGQGEVLAFFNMLHEKMGSEEGYAAVCEAAQATGFHVSPDLLAMVDTRFVRFDTAARPGHDLGHFRRDELAAFAYAFGDPGFTNAAYPVEVQAALIPGGRHDTVSVAVYPRYLNMPAAHAQVGAFMYYHLTEGLMPEEARLLGAYFIGAHDHQRKDLEYTEPFNYIRKPLPEAMFEREGKLARVGVWMVRACDRSDTNGLTQALRHPLANADVVESGIVGQDVTAGGESGFFEMDVEALKVGFLPEVRGSWLNPPTIAEHVLDYAKSQDGSSPYSVNDKLFPMVQQVITAKRKEAETFSSYLTAKLRRSTYTEARLHVKFASLLRVASDSPDFDDVWPIIWRAMSQQDEVTKNAWFAALFKAEELYADWVEYLGDLALQHAPEEFHAYIKARITSALS